MRHEPNWPKTPTHNKTQGRVHESASAWVGQPKTSTADHCSRVSGPLGRNALGRWETDLKRWTTLRMDSVLRRYPPRERETYDRLHITVCRRPATTRLRRASVALRYPRRRASQHARCSCLAPTTRLTSPSVPPEEAVKCRLAADRRLTVDRVAGTDRP